MYKTEILACAVIVAIIVLVVMAFLCVSFVGTGNTGIVVRFGAVQDKTFDPGFHFKSPFKKVIQMDNREQTSEITMLAFSKDIQEVSLKMNINYRLLKGYSADMYKDVGKKYEGIVITPRVFELTKNIVSEYDAEQIVSKREDISKMIKGRLSSEMSEYGIVIQQISLSDIDFTDAYTNAVEAKQVASQTKLQSEIDQARTLAEATTQQSKEKLAADTAAYRLMQEADANAYAIQAEAEANAEANKKIAESLTPSLIEYQKIMQWDGAVSQVQMSEGNSLYPVIEMK